MSFLVLSNFSSRDSICFIFSFVPNLGDGKGYQSQPWSYILFTLMLRPGLKNGMDRVQAWAQSALRSFSQEKKTWWDRLRQINLKKITDKKVSWMRNDS